MIAGDKKLRGGGDDDIVLKVLKQDEIDKMQAKARKQELKLKINQLYKHD